MCRCSTSMGVGQAASIPADAAMGRGWMLGPSFAGSKGWHVPPCILADVRRAAARPPAPPNSDRTPRRTILAEVYVARLNRHRQPTAVMAQALYRVWQSAIATFDAAAIRYRRVRGWRRAQRLAQRWAADVLEEDTASAAVYWTHIDRV